MTAKLKLLTLGNLEENCELELKHWFEKGYGCVVHQVESLKDWNQIRVYVSDYRSDELYTDLCRKLDHIFWLQLGLEEAPSNFHEHQHHCVQQYHSALLHYIESPHLPVYFNRLVEVFGNISHDQGLLFNELGIEIHNYLPNHEDELARLQKLLQAAITELCHLHQIPDSIQWQGAMTIHPA